MLEMYSDIIGIIGVSLVLLAYFLLNTSRLRSTQVSYLLLNFFGACLILISLYYHWNLASVVIEFCWILISIIGLYRIFKAQAETRG